MDTRSFHQFHDARYENILTVTDRIHFHFLTADVFIDQNRLVHIDFHGRF